MEKAESAVEACPSCMGNLGGVQMQKVKYVVGEGGDGFTEEQDLSVCRGIIKEAKALLVLTVCDYVLKDVKRPWELSVYQQERKKKMRAYWATGMEQSEMLTV